MVELIGDVCEPSDMKLPVHDGRVGTKEGEIFISGNKIWFFNGTAMEVVTSA